MYFLFADPYCKGRERTLHDFYANLRNRPKLLDITAMNYSSIGSILICKVVGDCMAPHQPVVNSAILT